MKKVLIIAIVCIGLISGCSKYSEGDKVIALPEYSDLRDGFIEATVVSSSGDKVVIRVDNLRGDNNITGYNEGEMKTVPVSILKNLEEGLILGEARGDFFRDRQLLAIFSKAARFQTVKYFDLPLNKWIEKADKAGLTEWTTVFRAINTTKEYIDSNGKPESPSNSKLAEIVSNIADEEVIRINDFGKALLNKEYVRNDTSFLTNTPVILLRNSFKELASVEKGVTFDIQNPEEWYESLLIVKQSIEKLNIALSKALGKQGIQEGTYKEAVIKIYKDKLESEAKAFVSSKIKVTPSVTEKQIETGLRERFAHIKSDVVESAVKAGLASFANFHAKELAIKERAALRARIHAELMLPEYWSVLERPNYGREKVFKLIFKPVVNNAAKVVWKQKGRANQDGYLQIEGNQITLWKNNIKYINEYELGAKTLVLRSGRSVLHLKAVTKEDVALSKKKAQEEKAARIKKLAAIKKELIGHWAGTGTNKTAVGDLLKGVKVALVVAKGNKSNQLKVRINLDGVEFSETYTAEGSFGLDGVLHIKSTVRIKHADLAYSRDMSVYLAEFVGFKFKTEKGVLVGYARWGVDRKIILTMDKL